MKHHISNTTGKPALFTATLASLFILSACSGLTEQLAQAKRGLDALNQAKNYQSSENSETIDGEFDDALPGSIADAIAEENREDNANDIANTDQASGTDSTDGANGATTPARQALCQSTTCVRTSDWTDKLGIAPGTTPSTQNPRNQFLRGTATQLNHGSLHNGGGRAPIISTLTLDDNAIGGVSFFRGFSAATTTQFYAGILADTNVGEPLPAPNPNAAGATTAQWAGQIQYYRYNELAPSQDFTLTVDFANRNIAAFVAYDEDGIAHFKLDGTFDADGVIEGTAVYGAFADGNPNQLINDGAYTPGDLSGLIGQDGAVAAFVSNNEGIGSRPFAGGFVASPAE